MSLKPQPKHDHSSLIGEYRPLWEAFMRLGNKDEMSEAEWNLWEEYRNFFFCSSPNWDLQGEYLDYVQYATCKICHELRHPVLFMSEKVTIREQLNNSLICRLCYPEAIKHKKPPEWESIEPKYKNIF